MSWGQPEEVPLQQSTWGENQAQSTWGDNQTQSTWGEQPQQTNAPAWGDQQENKGDQTKEGGRGGRGGRGRGGRGRGEFRGGRGGRGGRGRGRGSDENQGNTGDNNNQGESKPENSGGWGTENQENKDPQQQGGWGTENTGTTTEGGWGQQSSWGNQAPQEQEEGEVKEKRRGKKSDSPPPAKRPRPNPIVIVVEDDDSETQNFIVAENLKSKGLIKGEDVQICYEGNLKIEDCVLNTKFISYDIDQKVKIQDVEEYSIENAKDELKAIGDDIFLGFVEGLDEENQKAINKLADNLLDKQQAIHFKEISLFSTKQLLKVDSKSRLAFVRKLQI